MSQRYIGGLIYNPPGGFSGYFDGSGDYLSVGDQTAFEFGSGDYTVELWWFPTSSSNQNLIGKWDGGGSEWILQWRSSGYYRWASGGSVVSDSATMTLALNTWNHVVVTKTGTSLRIYTNGSQINTTATEGTISATGAALTIGDAQIPSSPAPVTGYISNVRLLKGTALYTSSTYTVPSGPLQAITNTSLLTCAYPTFRDGSSNNFTITVNGNTAVSTQNPFPLTQLPNPALGNQGNGVYSMSQYQALKQQNLWPAIDPYFDYVTLMLHGNGTNGAQNNTFLDSSTNNFTITRNGNTTQGTFTPYGSNWSNYFDGASDLRIASNAAFAPGTGDFTCEMWINPSSWATAAPIFVAAATGGLWIGKNGSNFVVRAYDVADQLQYGALPNTNTWTNIVAVRSGTTLSLYYNGSRVATTTNSYNFAQGAVGIGSDRSATSPAYYTGYVSNLRLVKGTAVYDPTQTTITVPANPITAITNTSLLTCQSNRFIDNSSNAFAVTVNGSPSVQRFSPFNPTTPYAAGTIGGSGYFDGVGDYLNCGSNAALRPGTGDYTIEMWVYLPTFSTDMYLISQDFNNAGASFGNFLFYADNTTGTCKFFSSTSGSSWNVVNALSMGSLRVNEWTHFAVARQSGTVRTFRNGDLIASTSDGSADLSNTGNVLIATYGANIDTNAYMSGIRLQKGTAQYTASFTCPTTPPTAITNTQLLLNFTNGGIIDNAMMNDLETVGNAQISTSVSKFGGGSLAFDGTGDWLTMPNSKGLYIGSGDFTIEGWLYLNALGSVRAIVSQFNSNGTGPGWTLYTKTTNVLEFYGGSGTVTVTGTTAIAATTWTHFAVVRSGSTITIYVNGVAGGTATNSSFSDDTTALGYVGGRADSSGIALNGYIDDLRITKYARYTTNFTPQRSQWQDQ